MQLFLKGEMKSSFFFCFISVLLYNFIIYQALPCCNSQGYPTCCGHQCSNYNLIMPKAQSFTQLAVLVVFMIWICQLTLIAKILYAKSGIVKIPYAKIPIDKIPYAESALCQNSNCQNTLEPKVHPPICNGDYKKSSYLLTFSYWQKTL